jgi:two-component system, NtrC family, response regulator AtoC
MAPHTIETLRLLAVGSEPSVLRLLDTAAHANDWHLETSASGWDALEQVQSPTAPHLLLLSIPRGEGEGLQLLPWLRRLRPELPIVVVCDADDAAKQQEATRLGAKDVLLPPFSERQLESVIRRHLGTSNDSTDIEVASEDIESLGEDEFFLSISPAMRQLRAQAELLAKADVPVLILGEPGSGKGTVARLIHQRSVHSGFKFQRVNCAEMPADLLGIELFGRENGSSNGSSRALGKLESGQKGTILLDEITEMPLALQARVLKVLLGKQGARASDAGPTEVDVRVLAASSEKMDRALEEKRMNGDLYYRLSAFTVHIPSLRHRKDEIGALLRYSMHKVAKYYGLPPRDFTRATLEACQNYSWPGNLKELEMFVKRYLIAGDVELPGSLEASEHAQGSLLIGGHAEVVAGENSSSPTSLKSMIQNVRWETERNAIAAALEKTGWNRKAAARLLGVSYRTILYKIEQYEMRAPESYLSPIPGTTMNLSGQNKGSGK